MIDFLPLPNENETQYVWRIGQEVDKGNMTWQEAADIINQTWRDDEEHYFCESAYRKPFQYSKKFYELSNLRNQR